MGEEGEGTGEAAGLEEREMPLVAPPRLLTKRLNSKARPGEEGGGGRPPGPPTAPGVSRPWRDEVEKKWEGGEAPG